MATRSVQRAPSKGQVPPQPSIVSELERAFAALDDGPLLKALEGPTRRGPKGYPVETLWRCVVTKYYLGIDSTAALLRALEYNPYLASVCGVSSEDGIPSEPTMSRFLTRISSFRNLPKLKNVSRSMVRKCYETIPGFGKRVAIDSTVFKAWANGFSSPESDPDAEWNIKLGTNGRKQYTYGYKLHLAVDCETELPIAAGVSTGSVHDSKKAPPVLAEARTTYPKFHPDFIIADAGYSSKKLISTIRWQYSSTPVIQLNKGHRKLIERLGEQMRTPEMRALSRQRQAVERVFSRLKEVSSKSV